MKVLLFSDLDGSLLDHDTYGLDEARGTVEAVRRSGASIILNSSKTDVEIRNYADALALSEPFICEGGGLVLCPAGMFPEFPPDVQDEGGYDVYLLGRSVEELRESFAAMRAELGTPLRAVFEMDDAELQRLTGLREDIVPLMRRRRASVPFVHVGGGKTGELAAVREWAEVRGLGYTLGGRFHHLTGPGDKGAAAARLTEMYRGRFPELITVGVGDGLNDLPLLRWADHAIAIPAKDGLRPELAAVSGVRVAPEPGPAGWKAAVEALFRELHIRLFNPAFQK